VIFEIAGVFLQSGGGDLGLTGMPLLIGAAWTNLSRWLTDRRLGAATASGRWRSAAPGGGLVGELAGAGDTGPPGNQM
jgi:hypothetical protein